MNLIRFMSHFVRIRQFVIINKHVRNVHNIHQNKPKSFLVLFLLHITSSWNAKVKLFSLNEKKGDTHIRSHKSAYDLFRLCPTRKSFEFSQNFHGKMPQRIKWNTTDTIFRRKNLEKRSNSAVRISLWYFDNTKKTWHQDDL